MKKLLFLVIAFVVATLAIALPVYAQEKSENVILQADQTHTGDYFAPGDNVEILGTVNGDAYAAGGSVVFEGTINGDLLAAGGNITISGTVQGDVRVAGGSITIAGANIGGNITAIGGNITIDSSSEIAGSLVSAGGNIQVLSPLGRGATIGAGTLSLSNIIGGNVLAGVGELSLLPGTDINGDLTYASDTEANISSDATIAGKITHQIPERGGMDGETAEKAIGAAAAAIGLTISAVDLFWLLIVGLLFVHFFPNLTNRAQEYTRKNLLMACVTGIIALIVIPVIGFIFFMTIIGIPIALLLLFVYIFVLWFARIFAIYALGREIVTRAKLKTGTNWSYIIGLVAYIILSLIPIIGFLAEIIILLAGVGTFLVTKKNYFTELRTKKLI